MRVLAWCVMSEEGGAWWWASLWHRSHRNRARLADAGPAATARRWCQHVQAPQTEAERMTLRRSVVRASPFGNADWQQRTAKRLGIESTCRPRGRP
jgi:putative transposase